MYKLLHFLKDKIQKQAKQNQEITKKKEEKTNLNNK